MTKLKTLNDLKEWNFEDEYGVTCLNIKDLKQMAIKLIKHFRSGEAWTDFAADERKGQENIEEWIEYFFNLTEDDLK